MRGRGRLPRQAKPAGKAAAGLRSARGDVLLGEGDVPQGRRESCFVLLTNVDDEERFPDRETLRLYKGQQLVEQHFSFTKDPKMVGPVYLKKPARVNALAYVFLLALLVYAFIQFRVRRSLKDGREPLMVSGKVKTFSPTGRRVLQLFERMKVIRYENGRRRIPDNVRVPERVLGYLGLPVEIYLRHLPP
ncbi:MAG: hypothetical protein AB1445_01265 [Bacillota bacterium]